MKKILVIINFIVLVLTLDLYAQEISSENYKSTPETKKFEGTWGFNSGSIKLILKLENHEKFYIKSTQTYADVIQGSVLYIKNGKVIYQNENAIIHGRTGSSMPFELWAIFQDPNGTGGRLILTFLNHNDINSLNLKLVQRNHLDPSKHPPLKIPQEIILKREK